MIFISAAEQSADEHAANLIRATLARQPDVRFVGVAGPRMVAAGCDSIFDMTRHSAMLLGAIGAVGHAVRMLRTADEHLRMYPFDAAVVIDSPTLHLPLARRAKAAGVPVLYYIAPQMWAWGAYRIYKLRHNVRKVACILPFEEEYFRNQGVDARFVGHPLADKWSKEPIDASIVQSLRPKGSPTIALLPGSRAHVVRENLPGQLEVAEGVLRSFPSANCVASIANPQTAEIVRAMLARSGVPVTAFDGPVGHVIEAADLVLVASGTTTLEVALRGKPMIVMYNASRAFYHLIGRWMIRTPYLSLPNILAGREIVPEFMPYYRSTEPIVRRAIALLSDAALRSRMVQDLTAAVEPIRSTQASENTAKMLIEMIAARRH